LATKAFSFARGGWWAFSCDLQNAWVLFLYTLFYILDISQIPTLINFLIPSIIGAVLLLGFRLKR
jgi:hypothetical protein